MELLTLDNNPASSTRFQPLKLIENYASLIWTERYWSAGDFELKSSDVQQTINAMPLESVVGIRESITPMVVEAYKIEKPGTKESTITVTGRSYESVLERRASFSENTRAATPPRNAAFQTISADKVSDAAFKMLRNAIGDTAKSNLPAVNPTNLRDQIPELNLLLPTDYTTGVVTPFEIKAGNLLAILFDMLEVNHHGIRAIRPTFGSGKTKVDLEIYNGADLRSTVVFDARFDQLNSANYLLSYQGSTNVAYVYGPSGVELVKKNEPVAEPEGLARRVLVVDEMSDSTLSTQANRKARGLVELYKNNATALFDGEVAIQVAQRFNKPIAQGGFGLGDILQLNGEYGLGRAMRVAEWVRTSDSTGESAYPTFQTVDD